MKTLGKYIRELRTEQGVSLRTFATDRLSISPAYLSDIELGRRHPPDHLRKKIAEQLGVQVEELERLDTQLAAQQVRRDMQDLPARAVLYRKLGERLDKRGLRGLDPEEVLELLDKMVDKSDKSGENS